MILDIFDLCKQKKAYEIRISDWSSDVCSSDLAKPQAQPTEHGIVLRDSDRRRHRHRSRRAQDRRDDLERGALAGLAVDLDKRSDERRVGKECVSTCRSRWAPCHQQKKTNNKQYSIMKSIHYNNEYN